MVVIRNNRHKYPGSCIQCQAQAKDFTKLLRHFVLGYSLFELTARFEQVCVDEQEKTKIIFGRYSGTLVRSM